MKAGRLILIVLLGGALAAAGVLTYKRWPGSANPGKREQANSSTQTLVSSVPPFSTKEPERYQATRLITTVGDESDQVAAGVTRILIARDGDKRREDYDSGSDLRTSYLETPAGTFVLLPSQRLYADIESASNGPVPTSSSDDPRDDTEADFSSPALLYESGDAARYEKLGSEKLEGRATVKYRVSSSGATNGTEPASATLIWIDDALGIPIRTETEISDNTHRSKLTVELRDIRSQVDPNLFELPKDYKKVDYSEFWARLKQTRVAARESGKP